MLRDQPRLLAQDPGSRENMAVSLPVGGFRCCTQPSKPAVAARRLDRLDFTNSPIIVLLTRQYTHHVCPVTNRLVWHKILVEGKYLPHWCGNSAVCTPPAVAAPRQEGLGFMIIPAIALQRANTLVHVL